MQGYKRAGWAAGFTLVELMVVVTIIGLLAAIAIPVFSRYAREAKLTEAQTNIQGIFEAEEAYFVRFQRYTTNLPACPVNPPADHKQNQLYDATLCDAGWLILGWRPDDAVYFQYSVFSLYDADGVKANDPTDLPNQGTWGVNWGTEFGGGDPTLMQPWCAVEASADTDGDGEPVFFRGNSYNHSVFRSNDNDLSPDEGERTY